MAFVWICGATGAVGSALARRLDAKGVSMVLTARHADSLGALADTMSRERVVVAPADATDAAALDRALEAGVERFGVPDGLAHCVGPFLGPRRQLGLTVCPAMRCLTVRRNRTASPPRTATRRPLQRRVLLRRGLASSGSPCMASPMCLLAQTRP